MVTEADLGLIIFFVIMGYYFVFNLWLEEKRKNKMIQKQLFDKINSIAEYQHIIDDLNFKLGQSETLLILKKNEK